MKFPPIPRDCKWFISCLCGSVKRISNVEVQNGWFDRISMLYLYNFSKVKLYILKLNFVKLNLQTAAREEPNGSVTSTSVLLPFLVLMFLAYLVVFV